MLGAGGGGLAAVAVAGGGALELVARGVLPGRQELDHLDGACSVAGPPLVFSAPGASVSGSYVISTGYMAETKVTNVVGSFAADGAGNISGPDTIAVVNPADSSTTVDTLTGTYSTSPNGRGTIAFTSPNGMPGSFVFYVVSPSTVRLVSSTPADVDPVLYSFDH